ncbi:MAG: SBBP repeat-containing protein [Bacteroidota bacterium]
MKIFYIITLLPAFCGLSINASSQNFVWAKQMGGTGSDLGNSIAVDANGNVYTTGNFTGTSDFDPGTGTYNLTSAGIVDIFVSKLGPSGNFVWAKKMGGTGSDGGRSIAVDAAGNIYTTGVFEGTSDFNPGTGIYNLTSTGMFDIFVSKLDSSGNFLWAKQMGAANDDRGYSIAVDAIGNVYTTGYFQDTVDFDPGPGTYNLISAGSHDIFISKLDSSGNFLFAKQLGGTSGDEGKSIAVDAYGSIYTTGIFADTVDFDPGTGTFNLISLAGNGRVFVSKLDSSGNFLWAKQLSDNSTSIAVDVSGNVYTTGYFSFTDDFDPGIGTYNLSASSSNDVFISKLDSSGNFVWAKQIGGNSPAEGFSIAVDATGNVVSTGWFFGTVDFDPGIATYNLTSVGGYSIFVSKLDYSGNFLWANKMGGGGSLDDDGGNSVAIDTSENVYITGYFNGACDFDPGTGTYILSTASPYDIFVEKLSVTPTGITENNNSLNEVNIFPNPGNGQIKIKSSDSLEEIKITDLLGQIIYQTKPNENNLSLQLDETGIYFIQITTDKKTITKILIVCK